MKNIQAESVTRCNDYGSLCLAEVNNLFVKDQSKCLSFKSEVLCGNYTTAPCVVEAAR